MPQKLCRSSFVETLEPRWLLTMLLSGHNVNLYGTSLAASPGLAGSIIYEHSTPFTATGTDGVVRFQGTLNEQIVRESRRGTLDFYHTVQSDPTSRNNYRADTERSFSGFKTDVDYRTDLGGTIAPWNASRSADGVTFNFGGAIGYGQQTVSYFIKTDATQFDTNGSSSLLFGSVDYRTGRSYLGFATVPIAEPIATKAAVAPTLTSTSPRVATNHEGSSHVTDVYTLIDASDSEPLL